jgi:hypothetical protein
MSFNDPIGTFILETNKIDHFEFPPSYSTIGWNHFLGLEETKNSYLLLLQKDFGQHDPKLISLLKECIV